MPAATSAGTSSRRGSCPAQITIGVDASTCGSPSTVTCKPASSMRIVLDAGEHRHAALLEQRAADPAGGLRESRADLRLLALQQPDLRAPARSSCAAMQSAALRDSRRRCPTRRETPRSRDRRDVAVARVPVRRVAGGQELGDVEADAAGADDRDRAPRGLRARRRCRRSSRPWDGRCRGSRARAARCRSRRSRRRSRARSSPSRALPERARRRRAAPAACGSSAASRRTLPCRGCAARG